MSDTSSIDNAADDRSPDAHGQAALLLAESILHGLLDKGIMTIDEVIDVTSAAAEVKEDIIADHREPVALGLYSLELIERITASLRVDEAR